MSIRGSMDQSPETRLPALSRVRGSRSSPVLAGLPTEAFALLQKHFSEQDFWEGAALWNAGDRVGQVYFPLSGMISIRVPTKDGHGIEVATVGHEGAAGFLDGSGALPASTQAVVRAPGRFIVISAQALAAAARQDEDVGHVAAVCAGWLLAQAQQTAACNAVHPADARICRWLLRASDALGAEMVAVTQEAIAQALGIRRTTATLIAQQLQLQGIISYSRGKIIIRDRAALQSAACNCHHALGRRRWPSDLLLARNAPDGIGHSAIAG